MTFGITCGSHKHLRLQLAKNEYLAPVIYTIYDKPWLLTRKIFQYEAQKVMNSAKAELIF